MKATDQAVMDLLDHAAVTYQLVLTKIDTLKPPALQQKLAETTATARNHPAAHMQVLATSSETGEGIPELRATAAELATQ
jgi:GTP-binding protein